MDLAAPANGLKLMLLIVVVLGLIAVYGRWQHSHRADFVHATITNVPPASPSPNER